MKRISEQCQTAYKVSPTLATLSADIKNKALSDMADAILVESAYILAENEKDLAEGRKEGIADSLLDRLRLDGGRLTSISDGIRAIVALPDPIGEVIHGWTVPNGLKIEKIRVPLGVVGMIYEARPNVTADAVALTIKTGNAVVLRGSSSAYRSNKALATVMRKAGEKAGVPGDAIQLLEDTSREGVKEFVCQDRYLSVIIPRGGAGLIQSVIQNATVPTIETGVGNCHVYVDASADLTMAHTITMNAKTHRPSVCNACETLLVHETVAKTFLPDILNSLREKGVEIRGCDKTRALFPEAIKATEEDWATEYLAMILAVKVVASLDEAISHISRYGTKHSEAIVAYDVRAVDRFVNEVDAAAVLVNASTRFTDGGEFGFGAEIGISTQKLHARGPMGLAEMTTYKYVVKGNGHIRK